MRNKMMAMTASSNSVPCRFPGVAPVRFADKRLSALKSGDAIYFSGSVAGKKKAHKLLVGAFAGLAALSTLLTACGPNAAERLNQACTDPAPVTQCLETTHQYVDSQHADERAAGLSRLLGQPVSMEEKAAAVSKGLNDQDSGVFNVAVWGTGFLAQDPSADPALRQILQKIYDNKPYRQAYDDTWINPCGMMIPDGNGGINCYPLVEPTTSYRTIVPPQFIEGRAQLADYVSTHTPAT
jgi:hypothetical protein